MEIPGLAESHADGPWVGKEEQGGGVGGAGVGGWMDPV